MNAKTLCTQADSLLCRYNEHVEDPSQQLPASSPGQYH